MSQATPHTDPNVQVPAAVRAAAARADQVYNTAYKKDEPPAKPEGEDVDAAPGGGTGTEPAEPEAAAAPETPAEKATTEGNQPPPAKEVDWEHRYNSLKGRFDRREDDVRRMSEQIANLQRVMATMQQTPQPNESGSEVERFVTEKEVEEYGQEFLDVVGRKAKEIAGSEITRLEREIAGLKSQLGNVGTHVAAGARERMLETLEQRIPNWRDVNRDENFLQWLQLPDAYSGAIRHNLLKEAFENNDSSRVLAFFNGFLAEEAAVAPDKGEPDNFGATPAQPGPAKHPKVPLETFAAPGRAKSAAASGAPTEKPIITRAQITRFYADVGAGKYRGREAEKDRLEKQIFEAQSEGRLR